MKCKFCDFPSMVDCGGGIHLCSSHLAWVSIVEMVQAKMGLDYDAAGQFAQQAIEDLIMRNNFRIRTQN